MKRVGVLIISACALFSASASAQSVAPPPGDAAAGKTLFNQVCAICHQAKSTPMGPALAGVFGRKAGLAADFKYSPAMAASGVTWDAPTLNAYLAAPMTMIKGSRMPINVAKPADRANLIAYMKTLK